MAEMKKKKRKKKAKKKLKTFKNIFEQARERRKKAMGDL